MTSKISTTSAKETFQLGLEIAQYLKGGQMIELRGDLGAGKTTFLQGIARGLGVTGNLPSPTFTLSREYELPDRRSLHHFDLYRLHDRDMVTQALEEAVSDPQAIVACEWADNGTGVLPDNRIIVTLEYGESETERAIQIEGLKL